MFLHLQPVPPALLFVHRSVSCFFAAASIHRHDDLCRYGARRNRTQASPPEFHPILAVPIPAATRILLLSAFLQWFVLGSPQSPSPSGSPTHLKHALSTTIHTTLSVNGHFLSLWLCLRPNTRVAPKP